MHPQWALGLAVQDDLRFLSHHEMMRTVERILARCEVPLRYSEGFNPRPIMSLPCPRPVGVASACDLLVVSLTQPATVEQADGWLERLNGQAPPGLRFTHGELLDKRAAKKPVRVEYELPLSESQRQGVALRLDELAPLTQWPMQRLRGDEAAAPARAMDLRPLVRRMDLSDRSLRIELSPQGDLWARPAEVLRLLNLDEREDLSRLARTRIDFA